jgi:hypothetical protein
MAAAATDAERQQILNRSDVYLDAKEFGLALGEREPLDLETLDRRAPPKPNVSSRPPESVAPADGSRTSASPRFLPALPVPAATPAVPPGTPAPRLDPVASSRQASASLEEAPTATEQDVAKFQARYQVELDALAKEGLLKFHFVDYAPPSFVLFQDHVALQLTMRNPARFDREHTSIYKRAAQSFDLFLAPLLKDLLSRISSEVEFPALDITIISQFQSPSSGSPEAIEYVCPLKTMREFADARITNQDLINQSVVLVNGVRITLDLQKVE